MTTTAIRSRWKNGLAFRTAPGPAPAAKAKRSPSLEDTPAAARPPPPPRRPSLVPPLFARGTRSAYTWASWSLLKRNEAAVDTAQQSELAAQQRDAARKGRLEQQKHGVVAHQPGAVAAEPTSPTSSAAVEPPTSQHSSARDAAGQTMVVAQERTAAATVACTGVSTCKGAEGVLAGGGAAGALGGVDVAEEGTPKRLPQTEEAEGGGAKRLPQTEEAEGGGAKRLPQTEEAEGGGGIGVGAAAAAAATATARVATASERRGVRTLVPPSGLGQPPAKQLQNTEVVALDPAERRELEQRVRRGAAAAGGGHGGGAYSAATSQRAAFADAGGVSSRGFSGRSSYRASSYRHSHRLHDGQASGYGGPGSTHRSALGSTRSIASSGWASAASRRSARSSASPTGRFHPDRTVRSQLRGCDPHSNINYLATCRHPTKRSATGDAWYTAPDNDRNMKEASYIASQSYIESLRVYGDPTMYVRASPRTGVVTYAAVPVQYSGNTTSRSQWAVRSSNGDSAVTHLEADVRMRLGIAPPLDDWSDKQLHHPWTEEGNGSMARHMAKHHARAHALSHAPHVLDSDTFREHLWRVDQSVARREAYRSPSPEAAAVRRNRQSRMPPGAHRSRLAAADGGADGGADDDGGKGGIKGGVKRRGQTRAKHAIDERARVADGYRTSSAHGSSGGGGARGGGRISGSAEPPPQYRVLSPHTEYDAALIVEITNERLRRPDSGMGREAWATAAAAGEPTATRRSHPGSGGMSDRGSVSTRVGAASPTSPSREGVCGGGWPASGGRAGRSLPWVAAEAEEASVPSLVPRPARRQEAEDEAEQLMKGRDGWREATPESVGGATVALDALATGNAPAAPSPLVGAPSGDDAALAAPPARCDAELSAAASSAPAAAGQELPTSGAARGEA